LKVDFKKKIVEKNTENDTNTSRTYFLGFLLFCFSIYCFFQKIFTKKDKKLSSNNISILKLKKKQ